MRRGSGGRTESGDVAVESIGFLPGTTINRQVSGERRWSIAFPAFTEQCRFARKQAKGNAPTSLFYQTTPPSPRVIPSRDEGAAPVQRDCATDRSAYSGGSARRR